MFCNNCGEKLNENENFCPKCGNKRKTIQNQEIKKSDGLLVASLIISIIAIILAIFTNVLAVILAIIGIVLGIISKPKGTIKIVSIALNIFAIFLVGIIILFSAIRDFNFSEKNEEIKENSVVVGKYNCTSFDGYNKKGNYIIRFEINSNYTFLWGKYGDTRNNYVKGTYTFKDLEKKNPSGNYSYYNIDITGDEFVENGRKQTEKYHSAYEFGITKENGKKQGIIMNTKTYNMYYCYEE